MADVIALVNDLFFQAKMQETARNVGVALNIVSSGDALVQEAQPDASSLVIVDLNAGGAIEAVQRLHASGNQRPIVAFLSHVQTELAERARAAGCREVMPRSKFTQDLASILSRAKN